MVRIMRHRQTKGPDSARPHLNRRATPRLHPWSYYLGRVDGDRGSDRANSQKRYQSRILAPARYCAVSAFMEHLRPSAGVYEVALGCASWFCNGSRNGSPGPYSKLILSCSTTSGRFCTRVWMVPMYSPMMPINSIWIDMKKNTPMTNGAIPTEK